MTSGSSLNNPRRKHALACLKKFFFKKCVWVNCGCECKSKKDPENVQLGVTAFGGSFVALKGAV